MSKAKKIILITDGDSSAARTVEVVARRVGGSCISASQGNPTVITGEKLLKLIKKAAKEPILVMVDDKGEPGKGQGESVLEYLANSSEVEILGTVAVAANSHTYQGIEVDFSIDKDGRKIEGPVNKNGCPEPCGNKFLEGDTVEILNALDIPIIVGTGDTGKMQGKDDWHLGAAITTRAVQEILARSEN